MTKKYTIKTALHAHPYFYCPITKKINLDEKFYRKFVSEEPSLQKIVENAFEKDVGICALSSCHTPTGGMDNRFKNYIKQLKTLDKNYDVDFHQDKGWLTIARKQPLKGKLSKIILLHSQEVRTNYNSNPADINVIGNKKLINHSLDVEETAKIAKSNGALSLVCLSSIKGTRYIASASVTSGDRSNPFNKKRPPSRARPCSKFSASIAS